MRVMITGAAGFLGRRLTAALIARGTLRDASGQERPITRLILCDLVSFAPPPVPEGMEVVCISGDLARAEVLSDLCAPGFDSLFHLASQLTLQAETDPDHAWTVNVTPLRALIGAAEGCPKVVFASSIAVFGGALPTEVSDDLAPLPETTYGTHKAVNELVIADASRLERIDGRSLRLPIVLIRPGAAMPVVSDRVAAIARDLLEGRDSTSPLPAECEMPVASAGCVVAGLIALHDAEAERLPPKRALNLPALTVSVAEMVAAAARAGATGQVHIAPDAKMQQVVASWPRHFSSHYAGGLGVRGDANFDVVIADYKAHRDA